MRAWLLLLTACEAADDGDDNVGDTDPGDTDSDAPPVGCTDVVATAIHGETPDATIAPGAEVPIVSGPQGGFHMELGMEVNSWAENVAWRIDLHETATGDLVGGVGQTVFTALTAYDDDTCLGHLNGRVFIGDGSSQTYDFACELAGTPIEARGWVEPLATNGEVPTESVEVTLAIVAGEACR